MKQLTDKAYARKLYATIGASRATPTSSVAKTMSEGTETTHYSVADANGNAVATTTTLNALYGSGVYVRGGGFFLNDEMDDFAAAPVNRTCLAWFRAKRTPFSRASGC
jgi:gamma-glutamyltranspeptidase/glutathione hydrolase